MKLRRHYCYYFLFYLYFIKVIISFDLKNEEELKAKEEELRIEEEQKAIQEELQEEKDLLQEEN